MNLKLWKGSVIMNNEKSVFVLNAEPQLTIDMPHQLKPKQIKEVNEVVSTMSKYENTLKNLRKVSLLLYHAYLDGGQHHDSEIYEMLLTIRDIRVAIEPAMEDGNYLPHTGLVGTWNKEKRCHNPYK